MISPAFIGAIASGVSVPADPLLTSRVLWIEGDTGFTDLSPTGATVHQVTTTPGAGSTYNSHASLNYTGTQVSEWTHASILAALNSQSFTLVWVGKSTANETGFTVAWNQFSDDSAYCGLFADAGANSDKPKAYLTDSGNGVHALNSTHASLTGTLNIIRLRVTPTTAYLSINGGTEESVAYVPRTNIDRIDLGALVRSSNSGGVQFDVNNTCAFVVYNISTTATDTDVATLRTKYGTP